MNRRTLDASLGFGSLARLGACWILLVLAAACSHSRGKVDANGARPDGFYEIRQLVPYTLKVRRPSGPGADPRVGPGGVDYQSSPRPDERFDCQDVEWLFREVKLESVRACLKDIPSGKRVLYRVKWLPEPFLELVDEEEETPACLRSTLAKIPVPREMFFQSTEGGRLACYSSRLPVEADEVGGFTLPIHKTALRIDFPLSPLPKDDGETRMLLMAWAMTPLWESEKSILPSKLVPDAICRKCLGEKIMLTPTSPEPILWPGSGPTSRGAVFAPTAPSGGAASPSVAPQVPQSQPSPVGDVLPSE